MFSVVIPLYNKELSITKTIKSVLKQTFQDFEIVIIDDGSTDSSVEQVKTLKDDRIRLIHQKNQGVSAARNLGIEEANFEWIALLDGDDLWEPNHLEEITKMMEHFPNEKVFVTSFEYSDNRIFYKHSRDNSIFKIENYFKEAISEPLIWTSIIVFHKSCIDNVGGFNKNLSHGEDLDLWARLSKKYNIIKSSVITAIYRTEAENRSISSRNLKRSLSYHIDLANSESIDEINYYKKGILNILRNCLVGHRFKDFLKVYSRHRKYITLAEVLRKRSL